MMAIEKGFTGTSSDPSSRNASASFPLLICCQSEHSANSQCWDLFATELDKKSYFLNKPCCIEDKPPVHVGQVQLAGESDEKRPSWNSVPLEWLAHLGVRCFAVYLYLYLFILCIFGISSHSNGLTTSVSIVLLIHLSPNTFKVVSTKLTK